MKQVTQYLSVLLIIGLCCLFVLWDAPLAYLEGILSMMGIWSAIAYVGILTAAVVFMPLTVMPIIPIAAQILGPLQTALLSIVGWTLGAAIAFLLARYVGRPVLERFVSLEKIDTYTEELPPKSHFWIIVLMRLTLPVDFVSYGLGFTKSLSFTRYIVATAVGVSWFSFAFAYMGDAFFEGNIFLLLEITLASIGVFAAGWYILHRIKK